MKTIKLFSIMMLIAFSISCADKVPDEKEPQATNNIDKSKSMQELLNETKENFNKNAPKVKVAAYQEGLDILKKSETMKNALKRGAIAPDFTAKLPDGSIISSDSIYAKAPVVLVWYRGGWCPYCNIQLSVYNDFLETFTKMGATLYAISPEIPAYTDDTGQRNELRYTLLSDSHNEAAKKFGIVYKLPDVVKNQFQGNIDLSAYNGDDSWELPLTVVYVIDKNRKIHYTYINYDYRERADPTELMMAIAELQENREKFH